MATNAAPKTGDIYLSFDGQGAHVQIPSRPQYSVDATGEFTVAAWMRADVEDFPRHNDNHYIHWLGKGNLSDVGGDQEWCFRMYNQTDVKEDEKQRTCFYVFNSVGRLGVGSFVPGPVKPRTWRHITAVVKNRCTHLYCNGGWVDCDTYLGERVDGCNLMFDQLGNRVEVQPKHGDAPLRLGTQNNKSFLQGGLTRVRIWNRALSCDEIQKLYMVDLAPRDQLCAEFLLNAEAAEAIDSVGGNHGDICGAKWEKQGAT